MLADKLYEDLKPVCSEEMIANVLMLQQFVLDEYSAYRLGARVVFPTERYVWTRCRRVFNNEKQSEQFTFTFFYTLLRFSLSRVTQMPERICYYRQDDHFVFLPAYRSPAIFLDDEGLPVWQIRGLEDWSEGISIYPNAVWALDKSGLLYNGQHIQLALSGYRCKIWPYD